MHCSRYVEDDCESVDKSVGISGGEPSNLAVVVETGREESEALELKENAEVKSGDPIEILAEVALSFETLVPQYRCDIFESIFF